MRSITVDVPFGFSFALRTRVPGVLSIDYKTPKSGTQSDDVSMPLVGSSKCLEGESHEIRIDVPPPPTSLQPTEKAYDGNDPENQQEYCIERLKSLGIPTRDFALEPYPNDRKAPEIFDPCVAFLKYGLGVKMMIREVRQLMSLGWLMEVQAKAGVTPEQWSLLNQRTSTPEYPWTPLKFEQPTGTSEEIMASLRRQLDLTYPGQRKIHIFDAPFGVNVNDGDDGNEEADVGMGELLQDTARSALQYNDNKRSRTDGTDNFSTRATEIDNLAEPQHKRRKLSSDVDVSARSHPQPCPRDHQLANNTSAYFTPSPPTSPLPPTFSAVQSNSGPSLSTGGTRTMPAEFRSRPLARTQQTLRSF